MSERVIETQVAVIGGGIIGAAVVRELSKYKVDVCLIEKESACGFGITKACQGLVHGGIAYLPSRIVKFHGGMELKDYLCQPFNLKERMGNIGREEYFALAPLLNEELIQPGRLMLAENEEDLKMVDLIKELADAQGIRGITVLDRKGLEEKEPLIHPKYIGGLFDANEAQALGTAWAIAFAENAEQNGAHLFKETEVKGIEEKKGYYLIRTNKGIFKAEYIVNAAGLFADEIADMVGAADFKVSGWKVQLLVLENRDYIHHVLCIVPQPQKGRLLIPTAHNSILAAHSLEPMTDKHDLSVTKDKLDELMTWPQDMVPAISMKHIVANFASFLTFNTKNPSDHLLECPKRGFINAVVSAPGLAPAPAMAREIVRMLSDEGLEVITRSDFNPHRYKAPRFIELPTEEKNEKIQAEPEFGHIVCRCEKVSEQEIREAVRAGSRTLDEIKFKTLAGMGRCQGGFCTSRVLKIMSEELGISPLELTKKGGDSYILKAETKDLISEEAKSHAN